MKREGITVISIGTELLLGETINTNLAFIGQELNRVGLQIDREICIGDTPEVMQAVFSQAMREAEAVITIGGLGPTSDDLTKEVAAAALGVELTIDEAVVAEIRTKYMQRRVEPKPRACERQACMPIGAEPVRNDWGTAPGVWWHDGAVALVMLPGPPRELQPMFRQNVLPRLQAWLKPREKRLNLTVFGTPESTVEHRTMAALIGLPRVVPSYCTRWGSCLVRLTVPIAEVALLEQATLCMQAEFGGDLQLGEVTPIESVIEELRTRGWRLSSAESCTGGGIGWRLTELAGVSDVYVGGAVTYSNELKERLLGVKAATLAEHGAVSEEVAGEMVLGAAERFATDAAISVTGIAGPGGGTAEKPVGTVWIGTCVRGDLLVTHHLYPYDRQGVRERTVSSAIDQLRRHIITFQATATTG